MIESFADKHSRDLFVAGKSRYLPPGIIRRAMQRLEYVHLAKQLDDLRVPASNGLHALHGDRKGQHAIRINKQWRVCFRFKDRDAYDVEVTDYH